MKGGNTTSMFKNFSKIFVVLFLFACPAWSFFSFSSNNLRGGINGGNNCAACTIVCIFLYFLSFMLFYVIGEFSDSNTRSKKDRKRKDKDIPPQKKK